MNKKGLLILAVYATLSFFAYANNLVNETNKLASALRNLENKLGEAPPPVPSRQPGYQYRPLPPLPEEEPSTTCPIPPKPRALPQTPSRETSEQEEMAEALAKINRGKGKGAMPAWMKLKRTSEYTPKPQKVEEAKPRPKSVYEISKLEIPQDASVRMKLLGNRAQQLQSSKDITANREEANNISGELRRINPTKDVDKNLAEKIEEIAKAALQ